MNVFDRRESEVRSYCRAFPTVFESASGPFLRSEDGREYIDFFAGAGTLNYGHNNPAIKAAVVEYLQRDGVLHALDMWTVAKRAFLEEFESIILAPRRLDFRVQFTGPTGTNAVEAALKLAKKVTGRSNIVAFTNGFHGLSAGALAVTGNRQFRHPSFVNRHNAAFMPFDGYLGEEIDTVAYLRRVLADASSGIDIPAAAIVETVQAEGGINVASVGWLQRLERVCREFDILLIVDDIQVGNGRTGAFFSFEEAGIRPDLVTLSKAIGGIGLPMALVLIRPELDQWKPAEHTGTFRGNNLAFVAARAALAYWRDDTLARETARKGDLVRGLLSDWTKQYPDAGLKVRGRGLINGLEIPRSGAASAIAREAFRRGLVIEVAGSEDQVLKFLPPLVIDDDILRRGMEIARESLADVLARRQPTLARVLPATPPEPQPVPTSPN